MAIKVDAGANALDCVDAKERIQAQAEASERGLVYIRSYPTNKARTPKSDKRANQVTTLKV